MTTELDNMIPVKASQLLAIQTECLRAGEAICVVGASGIGKSDINAQATAAVGFDNLTLHPVTYDPTDLKGLPVMTVNGAEFSAYGDLRLMRDATRPVNVFLDDLGQASNAVQAAVMQLVLARRINGHPISDHVRFTAATNGRSHRGGVSGLLDPLKKRMLMIYYKPDLTEFCVHAAALGFSNRVIAYLNLTAEEYPAYFYSEEPTSDMSVNASPRGWDRVSRHLALPHSADNQPAVFAGAVGKAAGAGFASFLRVYDNLVMPEVVFANPDKAPIPAEPSALWALCSSMAHKATPNTVQAFCRYMVRLVGSGKNEYVALALKTMVARDPTLQETGDYVHAMGGPLGRLMMGGR